MTSQTLHGADTKSGPSPQATAAAAPGAEQFVVNLCASTTPMALRQPQNPELRHYKFFISRRLEDGRERFRLHMGYFETQLQAEDMLQLVREVYPSAWVSEAPGKRLRARAQAEATAVPVPAAIPPIPVPAPPAPVAKAPPPAARAPVPEKKVPVAAPAAAAPESSARIKRVPPPPPVSRSNVREVLASLDETAKASAASAVPKSAVPTVQAVPGMSLTDSQVLSVLENDDIAQTKSTPAAYSVQLQWSVQPVDISKVPPLAIFSAYKLYTVEGNRDGRRWYGLRLGFFSDANAAKQVAHYVRSEFASVAVVPVSLKERDGANGTALAAGAPAAAAPAPAVAQPAAPARATLERLPEHSAEFKLFDETTERRVLEVTADSAPARTARTPAPQPAAAKPAPAKSSASRGKRVQAGEKRTPQTLEETLEILGADALSVDDKAGLGGAGFDGRADGVTDLAGSSQIKHLTMKVEERRNSRLGRLFGKMGERSKPAAGKAEGPGGFSNFNEFKGSRRVP